MIGVMGCEDNPVSFLPQFSKLTQNFRLIRQIKGAGRLIQHDEWGILDKGTAYTYLLTLPAR